MRKTKEASVLELVDILLLGKCSMIQSLTILLILYIKKRKDLVSYEIIEESNVMQHFEDYEYNHPLFNENMHIYSDSSVSDLLSKSINEEDINTFLNA